MGNTLWFCLEINADFYVASRAERRHNWKQAVWANLDSIESKNTIVVEGNTENSLDVTLFTVVCGKFRNIHEIIAPEWQLFNQLFLR